MSDLKKNLTDLGDWFKSKIRGKAPSAIHSGNKFEKTRRDTADLGTYEKACYELQPDSFAKKWQSAVGLAMGIRQSYAFLSVGTALMTGFMIAEVFAQGLGFWAYWLTIILAMLLIFTLAVFVEMMKDTSAKGVFKTNAQASKPEERAGTGKWLQMVFFTAISIGISAVGGSEMTKRLNDKTAGIDSTYTGKADSVKTLYLDQIKVYEEVITSNQEILAKPKIKKWQRNVSNAAILEAQESKMELMQVIDAKVNELNSQNKSDQLADNSKNKNMAFISAGIITVFEILFILSYYLEYWYHRGCKEEGINHEIISREWYMLNIEGSDLKLLDSDYPDRNRRQNQEQYAEENKSIGFKRANSRNPTNSARRTHCVVCHTVLDGRSDKIYCSKNCANKHYFN